MRKLKRILAAQFPGADLDEITPAGPGRVGGILIWDRFEGMEQLDRQEKLWEAIKVGLTKQEQGQINLILTLTAKELAAARE
jgi:hypothetical protein